MSKFGDAHGVTFGFLMLIQKAKITAGCFDDTQRRLISAGSDGSARVYINLIDYFRFGILVMDNA